MTYLLLTGRTQPMWGGQKLQACSGKDLSYTPIFGLWYRLWKVIIHNKLIASEWFNLRIKSNLPIWGRTGNLAAQ